MHTSVLQGIVYYRSLCYTTGLMANTDNNFRVVEVVWQHPTLRECVTIVAISHCKLEVIRKQLFTDTYRAE